MDCLKMFKLMLIIIINLKKLPLIPSVQVPPFWHGPDKQSSILVWHFVPLKPVPVQLHLKSLTKSVHLPPFKHGLDAQSSILLLHVDPSYPDTQLHV